MLVLPEQQAGVVFTVCHVVESWSVFMAHFTGQMLVAGLTLGVDALQDHFRKVVKPSYTNVFRDRGGLIGVVEFENQEDLDLAIRKLDDTEFKNPFERCYVRVIDDSDYKKDRGRSRSRSRLAPPASDGVLASL